MPAPPTNPHALYLDDRVGHPAEGCPDSFLYWPLWQLRQRGPLRHRCVICLGVSTPFQVEMPLKIPPRPTSLPNQDSWASNLDTAHSTGIIHSPANRRTIQLNSYLRLSYSLNREKVGDMGEKEGANHRNSVSDPSTCTHVKDVSWCCLRWYVRRQSSPRINQLLGPLSFHSPLQTEPHIASRFPHAKLRNDVSYRSSPSRPCSRRNRHRGRQRRGRS